MSILEYNGTAAANAVIMSHTMRVQKILFVEGVSDARVLEPLFENTFLAISAKGVAGAGLFHSHGVTDMVESQLQSY
jgi:hypothetical protein